MKNNLSDQQLEFRKTRSTIDTISIGTTFDEHLLCEKGGATTYWAVIAFYMENSFKSIGILLCKATLTISYLKKARFGATLIDGLTALHR